jgi:cellulose synthase/poly-beta-1,6-N-acetylglucosamine synthase-like glycosyltransferase
MFVGCIGYAYVGYPAALWLASLLWTRRKRPTPPFDVRECPRVSIVVPSHNEAGALRARLDNLLALRYPEDRLDVIVGSDGSTDDTAAVAAAIADPRVRLVAVSRRGGKTALLNMLVHVSEADVIVFTDANSRFDPDALTYLVAPFADPAIGCVTGELVYTNRDEAAIKHGEGLYWRIEGLVKALEGQFGATLVATGAIYAMRRRLCSALPPGISDDSVNPLIALAAGQRVIVEPRARAYEPAAATLGEEFNRKVRMVTRQIGAHLHVRYFLRPLRPILAARLISHKLLRWLVPYFALGAASANLCLLDRPLYYATGMAAIVGAVVFAAGWLALRRSLAVPGIVRIWVYFCVVNAAAFVGVLDFLRGRRHVVWSISPSTRMP